MGDGDENGVLVEVWGEWCVSDEVRVAMAVVVAASCVRRRGGYGETGEECESDDQSNFIGATEATRGVGRMQPCLSSMQDELV